MCTKFDLNECVPRLQWLCIELKEWIYGELHTGDAWNFWQSIIPKESTVYPVILAGDATYVTNFSGDGKVHPVYVPSGHISIENCNQSS